MTENQETDRWNVAEWRGKMLVDRDGERIGKLQEVYVDVENDEPQFATVKEGFIGRHLTFVPLGGITVGPDDLQVAVTKDQVEAAPNIELHGEELSQADESALYHHFELTTHRQTPRADAASPGADSTSRRQPGTGSKRSNLMSTSSRDRSLNPLLVRVNELMAGFLRAVALDLDGTFARNDVVSEAALGEIDRLRDGGLTAVLVTGRIAVELEAAFPGLREHFDAIVAENGAVLALGEDLNDLSEPVEESLVGALTELGIAFRRGRVLLAGAAADAQAVITAIGTLGLDYQVVRNRAALMVLPAGVSKGTGLLVALAELGISPHNVLGLDPPIG